MQQKPTGTKDLQEKWDRLEHIFNQLIEISNGDVKNKFQDRLDRIRVRREELERKPNKG